MRSLAIAWNPPVKNNLPQWQREYSIFASLKPKADYQITEPVSTCFEIFLNNRQIF